MSRRPMTSETALTVLRRFAGIDTFGEETEAPETQDNGA
jgi:hypothetical protein